jgi:hypothetical protein
MEISYLIYLIVGKVLIFFGMKFAEDNEIGNRFIRNLLSCGLCFGGWIFTALSFFLGVVLFRELFYFPIISQIFTGGISSLIVHLISVGWKEQFLTINIE